MNTATTCTIREVAAHAGVSIGTVSRVLNGGDGVRSRTLEKVLDSARMLNYQLPDRRPVHQTSSRNVMSTRTGNIGLYFATMQHGYADHPTSAAYLTGLTECCQQHGLHPITEYARPGLPMPSIVEQNKIDALIVKGEVTEDWLTQTAAKIPVVMLNAHEHDRVYDTVNCDDHHSGLDVTRHLWQRGHKRIAFIGDTPKHNMHIRRKQGYEQFMRIHDAYDAQLVHIHCDPTVVHDQPKKVYPMFIEKLKQWMNLPVDQRPTAIIAACDWVAAGVYRSAQQLGVSIPQDLSVVGFDNTPGLCDALMPALTSFEISLAQAARTAAEILIAKLHQQWHQSMPVMQLVAGQLVQRDSVREIK
ncbi:MAG: LacI family DNA-binding transcriptional regulator [Phycisphaeraceae bacterium JB051]